jgi:serine/threonine protein phosphatase PrpC
LVEAGIIKPDDIYTHPKRNQIYRSLGEKPVVDVDSFIVSLKAGDKLLLCSDGLWDMVRDPEIQRLMSAPTQDPSKTGQTLIQAALDGGGEDNVSVIVVSFSDSEVSSSGQTSMKGVQLLYKPETVTVPDLPQM